MHIRGVVRNKCCRKFLPYYLDKKKPVVEFNVCKVSARKSAKLQKPNSAVGVLMGVLYITKTFNTSYKEVFETSVDHLILLSVVST